MPAHLAYPGCCSGLSLGHARLGWGGEWRLNGGCHFQCPSKSGHPGVGWVACKPERQSGLQRLPSVFRIRAGGWSCSFLRRQKAPGLVLGAKLSPEAGPPTAALPDTTQPLRQRQRSDGSGAAFRTQLCAEGCRGPGWGMSAAFLLAKTGQVLLEAFLASSVRKNHR